MSLKKDLTLGQEHHPEQLLHLLLNVNYSKAALLKTSPITLIEDILTSIARIRPSDMIAHSLVHLKRVALLAPAAPPSLFPETIRDFNARWLCTQQKLSKNKVLTMGDVGRANALPPSSRGNTLIRPPSSLGSKSNGSPARFRSLSAGNSPKQASSRDSNAPNWRAQRKSTEKKFPTMEDDGRADALAASNKGHSPTRSPSSQGSKSSGSPARIRSMPTGNSASSLRLIEDNPVRPRSTLPYGSDRSPITENNKSFGPGHPLGKRPPSASGEVKESNDGVFFPEGVLFTRILTGNILPSQITNLAGPGIDAFLTSTEDYEYQGIKLALPSKEQPFTTNDSKELIKTLALNKEYEASVNLVGAWLLTIHTGALIIVPEHRKSETYQRFQQTVEGSACSLTETTSSREWVTADREFFKRDVRSGHVNIYKIELSGKQKNGLFLDRL